MRALSHPANHLLLEQFANGLDCETPGSNSLWTGKEVKTCASGSFPHHLLIKPVYWLQPAEGLGWLVMGMVTLENRGLPSLCSQASDSFGSVNPGGKSGSPRCLFTKGGWSTWGGFLEETYIQNHISASGIKHSNSLVCHCVFKSLCIDARGKNICVQKQNSSPN